MALAGRRSGPAVAVTVPAEAFPQLEDDSPISDRQRWREDYRRGRARRSTAIASLSTIVFLGVSCTVIFLSPGWPRVRESFFSGKVARDALPDILVGLWLNVRVLAITAVLVVLVGLLIAALRTLRGPIYFPVRALAAAYTDFFRGMPLIILLYLVGFGLPGLQLRGMPSSPVVLGTVALVLTYSAYVSEVFRAGIDSVHPSQRAAARSLGLTYGQTMRRVILPQAVRRVAPPLLNDFVALQKDVGLISVLGAVDAVRQAQIHSDAAFNFTPYFVAGVLFVLLAIPTIRVADAFSARATRRQQASGSL
jgi:polar amino acid transport system permease protein